MTRRLRKSIARGEAGMIFLGVALFSLMVGTGVTATYAWFEVSNQLQASNLALNFDTHDDLVLGLKNKKSEAGEIVNSASFTNASLKNIGYDPSPELDPVSSMFSKNWLGDGVYSSSKTPELRMAYAEKGSTTESAKAEGGFLQFEFYLQSTNDCYVFLDSSTYVKANESKNQGAANAYNSKKAASAPSITAEELDKIEDTVRISFYTDTGFYIYEPNVATSSVTKFYGPLNVSGADDYYDYVGEKETFYGEYSGGELVYDSPYAKDTQDFGDISSSFHAIHKEGVKGVNEDKSASNGVSFVKETTYTLDELTLPEGAASISVVDGKYYALGKEVHPLTTIRNTQSGSSSISTSEKKRVVVSIYVEGWDLDMTDVVGSGCFNLNLAFTGLNQPID